MQTQVRAPAEATKQQNQSAQKPAQLLVESPTVFEDARPEMAQLKAMQSMMDASQQNQNTLAMQAKMNNSAHVKNVQSLQMRMTAGALAQGKPTMQMRSIVENMGRPCKYGPGASRTVTVGHTMNAWLDPANPLRGQSANINTSQDDLMAWIKSIYPLAAGVMSVKGHLLNDNLGGTALDNNLYPISKGANGVHLSTAENYVKRAVWEKKQAVKYSVAVEGSDNYSGAAADNAQAAFRTTVWRWNDVNDPGQVGDIVYTANIVSNLGAPKVRNALNAVGGPLDNISGYGLKAPVKPADKVGELNGAEKVLRGKQPEGLRIGVAGGEVGYEPGEINTAVTGALDDDTVLGKAAFMMEKLPAEFVESYINDECRSMVMEVINTYSQGPDANVSDAIGLVMGLGLSGQFFGALPEELVKLILSEDKFQASCMYALEMFIQEEFESHVDAEAQGDGGPPT